MNARIRKLLIPVCLLAASGTVVGAESSGQLLKTVKSVGREGKGSVQAAQAFRELSKSKADVLPEILEAFQGAGPLAVNYLRNAVESIADSTIADGGKLPVADLEKIILDRKQDPRARSLSFELLSRVDKAAGKRLVPGMIDDPSPELRRLAVQRLIDQADALNKRKKNDRAVALYEEALAGALDDDQVKAVVKPLKDLGRTVDLQKHFGFLTRWQIIGPFDNRGMKGFDVPYPPESEVKLQAEYEGQLGAVKWQPIDTDDDYGIIDIAKSIKNYKGSAMYAVTEFDSGKAQKIQIRIGTSNSWKLWINGKLLFGREEYHRGMALDQYRVDAALKPGKNVILFKILQNEQTQDWAQKYQFQLRVCDAAGSAVLPKAGRRSAQAGERNTRTLTAQGDNR